MVRWRQCTVSQAEGRSTSTDWSTTAWSRPATAYGTGATNPPPPGVGRRQSSSFSASSSGSGGAASSAIVRQPDHYDLPVRPQYQQQGTGGLGAPSRAVRLFVSIYLWRPGREGEEASVLFWFCWWDCGAWMLFDVVAIIWSYFLVAVWLDTASGRDRGLGSFFWGGDLNRGTINSRCSTVYWSVSVWYGMVWWLSGERGGKKRLINRTRDFLFPNHFFSPLLRYFTNSPRRVEPVGSSKTWALVCGIHPRTEFFWTAPPHCFLTMLYCTVLFFPSFFQELRRRPT